MKIIKLIFVLLLFFNINNPLVADEFQNWLKSFKIVALEKGISEQTFISAMNNVKYLPKVIEYDRYQPEFYEDTKTYISKRTSVQKLTQGKIIYRKNILLINKVEKEFDVDKELLLALMGIETNFGKYLGKMDILSSLATLSFDKRRSDFFTKELIKILQLIDRVVIDYNVLY